eukprot:TRINITY_DN11508_c2_g1_i1.p1 TRINITY_DN11508_c2_g1~~TRINITY_DN11508_c2_g1_i1.p1  ORF type:complete len:550 (-),score=220.17 TRINITY_DN11508_c2_g1_i1:268-1917(-)
MATVQPVLVSNFKVSSPNVKYQDDVIISSYTYRNTKVEISPANEVTVIPTAQEYLFRTQRAVPKLGVMIVGLGGNNGSTLVASCIANRKGMTWRTKSGVKKANYYGSLTQASTVSLGCCSAGDQDGLGAEAFVPLKSMVPTVEPNEIVWGGWDISGASLADAMQRAQVLDWDLQAQLLPELASIKPLPSVYFPEFIAANQADRADNVLTGMSKQQLLDRLRSDIREFKAANALDKVVVLWSGTTERFSDVRDGLNDTWPALQAAIARGDSEVAPSTLFAVASILEHCPYINGSPQNTFVPGVIELAVREQVPIAGDDFKSGQTKLKSVLVDFLISAGIKPVSIVSYNHLGNNDGKNLSAPQQFRSKEITKSNVVDDMVASNQVLYEPAEQPDHTVVIKYVPYVGDSKRALDEYVSEIFMHGLNTIAIHNTCEDSLLAAPLILDLVILAELMTRVSYRTLSSAATSVDETEGEFRSFHPVLSILSYLLKAPMVPQGAPVVNALFKQRANIENVLRALVGLPAASNVGLEYVAPAFAGKPAQPAKRADEAN